MYSDTTISGTSTPRSSSSSSTESEISIFSSGSGSDFRTDAESRADADSPGRCFTSDFLAASLSSDSLTSLASTASITSRNTSSQLVLTEYTGESEDSSEDWKPPSPELVMPKQKRRNKIHPVRNNWVSSKKKVSKEQTLVSAGDSMLKDTKNGRRRPRLDSSKTSAAAMALPGARLNCVDPDHLAPIIRETFIDMNDCPSPSPEPEDLTTFTPVEDIRERTGSDEDGIQEERPQTALSGESISSFTEEIINRVCTAIVNKRYPTHKIILPAAAVPEAAAPEAAAPEATPSASKSPTEAPRCKRSSQRLKRFFLGLFCCGKGAEEDKPEEDKREEDMVTTSSATRPCGKKKSVFSRTRAFLKKTFGRNGCPKSHVAPHSGDLTQNPPTVQPELSRASCSTSA